MNRKTIVAWLRFFSMVGVYGGLLMPLVFVPVVIFPFVFSKLIALQILIGITFPIYLALAWMEPSVRPKKHILLGAILLYFLAVAASVVFGVDPARSWWGNQERMNGLFSLLHFLAWLLMATGLLKTWQQWKRLLNFEIVLSVIMALVSILQVPFPRLLLFPVGARIGGLLDNPIYMAEYQIFNLFFAAWLMIKTPSKNARAWYVVAMVLQLIAFFLAQTRGALVGLAAGLIVVGIVASQTMTDKRIKRAVIATVAFVFVAYGILFAFRNTTVIKNSPFERITSGFDVIPVPRFIAWKIAWEGFKERPLTGWGFDDFHILFNLKYNPQSLRYSQYETWFDRSHNAVMDVLAMTGTLGLIGFLAIYVALFRSVYRAYREKRIDSFSAALLTGLPVAYFVQNIFVFDHPAAFTTSYLLFALTIAISSSGFHLPGMEPVEVATTTVKKAREFPMTTFVIAELIALVIVYRYSVLPFQASQTMIEANSAFSMQPPQFEAGLELFKEAHAIPTPYSDEQAYLAATNLTPLASDPSLRSSPVREDLLSFTKQVIQEEIARHPRSTNMLFLAARFYQEMSVYHATDANIAMDLYQQALATSPRRQQLLFAMADFSYKQNRPDEALKYEKQAVDEDPELGQAHLAYGVSLTYRKNDHVNGSKEILLSQTVSFPYTITDQEFPAVAESAFTLKDKTALELLITKYAATLGTTDNIAQLLGQFAQRLVQNNYQDLADELYRTVPAEILAQVRSYALPPATTITSVETSAATSTKTSTSTPVRK